MNEIQAILEVRNLRKMYGKLAAVNNVSFSINKGEVVGLVGSNGCGKTTLLRCITSLLDSDSGDVFVNGHDLFREPELAKKALAFVPEMPDLLFDAETVAENIAIYSRMYFCRDWKERAEELLEAFDLRYKANSFVSGLSKGQKQKVALIVAFIHEPSLIICDEPLLGIDPKGAEAVSRLIWEHKERGGSVLISSHMLDIIDELCDRVMIMGHGRFFMEGTMEEIRNYATGEGELGTELEDAYIRITEEAKLQTMLEERDRKAKNRWD